MAKASALEKQRILDEFCANCGYHRKHAIRLLNGAPPAAKPVGERGRRGRTYGARVISISKEVWEAADYPWSARLKALLPDWMPRIRFRFRITPEIERQLRQISALAMDDRLRPYKRRLRLRLYGRTKPGRLLKRHIPLKTDHWGVQVPGFTEIDLVSHSGNSASGDFCYFLIRTTARSLPMSICFTLVAPGPFDSRAAGLTRKTTTPTSSRRTGRTCYLRYDSEAAWEVTGSI